MSVFGVCVSVCVFAVIQNGLRRRDTAAFTCLITTNQQRPQRGGGHEDHQSPQYSPFLRQQQKMNSPISITYIFFYI